MKTLGILRETQNSPNRKSDDALILKAVMDQLSILKTETVVIAPEEFDLADVSAYDMIVPMCETCPPAEVRRTTADANAKAPGFEAEGGCSVKRADAHDACADDVVPDKWFA